MKDRPTLHISLSREHKDLQPQVAEVFKDFDVSFDAGLMRFSTEQLAMQVIIGIASDMAWDLLKKAIPKIYKTFKDVRVSLRDSSTMYSIRPDLTINVLVVPDRAKEFEHIKTLGDLVKHFNRVNPTNKYPTKKLGEICDTFTDGDWIETKDQSSSGIRLLQTGNIGAGVFIHKENSRERFINEATFRRLNCTEVFPGDILISRLPDPVGRACIVPDLDTRMVTAVDCTIVRPKATEICPDFLLLFLNSAKYFEQIDTLLTGTTRKRISRSNLGKIEIPVPPVGEQRKIVERIEKQFAKIDEVARLRAESQALAAQLLPAALHEIFSSAESRAWKEIELGELFQINRGGSPRPIKEHLTVAADGVNWIKIGDAHEGSKYITSTREKIKKTSTNKTRLVQEGDLVLSNSMSFGHPYILKIGGAIHDGWLLLRAKSNNIDKEFTYYILGSDALFQSFKSLAAGGVVKNLNSSLVRRVKIPLPLLAEQKQIVKKLDTLSEKVRTLQALQSTQSADLKALKQSILHEVFSNNW